MGKKGAMPKNALKIAIIVGLLLFAGLGYLLFLIWFKW
jgi:hypothetical protein